MKKDAAKIHEHIRLEAFLLSEQAGHPTGMDDTFWAQAEAIVHGRTAVVAGAGKALQVKAKASTPAKPVKKPAPAPVVAKAAPKKTSIPAKIEVPAKASAQAKPAAKRKK